MTEATPPTPAQDRRAALGLARRVLEQEGVPIVPSLWARVEKTAGGWAGCRDVPAMAVAAASDYLHHYAHEAMVAVGRRVQADADADAGKENFRP